MTPMKVTELPALETREDFLNHAMKLRTLAVHNHGAAPGFNAKYNPYSKQKEQTKSQVDKDLQADLQFLDSMSQQAGCGSIFEPEKPVVIRQIASK